MASAAQQQAGRAEAEPNLNNGSLQKFKLYETRQRFYLIGSDKHKRHFRVLKIDRSEPLELNVSEDPVIYTQQEVKNLLQRINEGNRSTGGLTFVTRAFGIADDHSTDFGDAGSQPSAAAFGHSYPHRIGDALVKCKPAEHAFSFLQAVALGINFFTLEGCSLLFTSSLSPPPNCVWTLLWADRKVRSGVPRTAASSHLFPLRQTQENKALQSSSRLLSQICRGKQISGLSASFQILIKLISGKTLLQWVRASDQVQDLKQALEIKLGIPSAAQRLLHEGKQLEDLNPLSFYSIKRNTSIALTLRLRGGATGQSSSAEAFSYKDAVHAKLPKRKAPPAQAPKPFLVDKLEETPSIEIMHPSLDEQTQRFAEYGIICRFNGLWQRTADLYQWIHSNWTNNCKVLLCSKGFFIVVFAFDEDYQKALTGGPWFWGAAGLFLTPWFPDFDPSTSVITKLPIWVRLPNLPANLWHFAVFQGIGNSLGRLLDTDISRGEKGLYTFARICAEIDISKGLPDQINLKIGDFHWTQTLDYENTAFRCRICHLTGHLQSSCPSMPAQKKKVNTKQKSKSWMPHDPPPMDDFDFSSDDEEENKEGVAAASEPDPSPAGPMDSSVIPASQKRIYESSTSDSDKETSPSAHLSLQIMPAQQCPPERVKVGKKKGKKCRIVDSAHVG